MNISHIHEGHHKFLIQSIKLCQAIDPYIEVLGLDINAVMMFKEEVRATLYVAEHYKSFANSFILYNKAAMQKLMAVLTSECLQSINYTHNIGKVLGIEEQIKFSAFASQESKIHIICKF